MSKIRWNAVKEIFSDILNLIFVSLDKCPFCGTAMEDSKVCEDCHQYILQARKMPHCKKCGRFFPSKSTKVLFCKECQKQNSLFVGIRAVVPYNELVKNGIHLLKYKKRKEIAIFLAQYMTDLFLKDEIFQDIDFLLPIPMGEKKFKERGFNQVELLAREMFSKINIPLLDCVKKNKDTLSQVGLGREERMFNLKDSFVVLNPKQIEGKNILLLDDVITTGSTLYTLGEILLKNGANSLKGLVFAAGKVKE